MQEAAERVAEKLGAPEERKWPLKPEFTPEMLAEMERLLPEKLKNRVVATSLAGCIHCGMCSDACHYSVSIP
ncbi:MAG: (Fe-S)-binding protein, partial [Thermodesulfobacteriota bacterium]